MSLRRKPPRPPPHTHTLTGKACRNPGWRFPPPHNEIIKPETMAPGPLADKTGMAAETSWREKSVSGCQYPPNLWFLFSFGPQRSAHAEPLTAWRKGPKPFCEFSDFSLMVLNFFLHELLEGGANDEVLCGVI